MFGLVRNATSSDGESLSLKAVLRRGAAIHWPARTVRVARRGVSADAEREEPQQRERPSKTTARRHARSLKRGLARKSVSVAFAETRPSETQRPWRQYDSRDQVYDA